MKTRQIFATALVLAAGMAPTLAGATCAGRAHETVSRCEAGQSWDAGRQRCVTPTSS